MNKKTGNTIELIDVVKTYAKGANSVVALNKVGLKIDRALMAAIVGPSGSGKSTLLHIIGGMDKPTSGTVRILGSELDSLNERGLTQYRLKKVGFVFQSFNLIPNLSALENVMLPMEFNSMPSSERIQRAKQLLEKVGLNDRLKHKLSELSGGQMQRVAIARALANDPAIILADEPTGNLDSESGTRIIELLRDIAKERIVIVATHNEKLVRKADKVFYIRDGVLK
jgi:ABC-type lipoprotein export system ATPase subunit